MNRQPPHDLGAERAVLGSVFIRPDAIRDLNGVLLTDDFYLPAHRYIYDAMLALFVAQRPCDPLMVADELDSAGTLPRLEGGRGYLMDLAGSVPTAERVSHYADIVREKAARRKVIAACSEGLERAYGDESSEEVLSSVSAELAKTATRSTVGLRAIGEFMPGLLDDIGRRAKSPDSIGGIETGVASLDAVIGGLRPGNLTVLAADSGGGKTALAVQTALNLCLDASGSAIVFNLEMTETELAERCLVYDARVNSQSARNGQIEYLEFRKMATSASKFAALPMYLESRCFTMAAVASKARAWRSRHPQQTGLVVLDFIQLMRGRGNKDESRARELGVIVTACKELAKELNVALILVSQFNRGPALQGRPPRKSDLKDASDIEQAADQIVLIHNPEQTEDGPVDIIVDKNRHGACRTVRAHWIGRYYQFSDDL